MLPAGLPGSSPLRDAGHPRYAGAERRPSTDEIAADGRATFRAVLLAAAKAWTA
jgi:hypothetical protein